jgi:DNA-binding NarL/FixJ family response regulator
MMNKPLMRVLVADDEPAVRRALRVLLKDWPNLEIVAEAADIEGVLAQVATACPDLLLLDWRLPDGAPGAVLPILRRIAPALWVIVFSARAEARDAALAAGADAFVSKVDPPDRLLAAIAACRCPRPAQA